MATRQERADRDDFPHHQHDCTAHDHPACPCTNEKRGIPPPPPPTQRTLSEDSLVLLASHVRSEPLPSMVSTSKQSDSVDRSCNSPIPSVTRSTAIQFDDRHKFPILVPLKPPTSSFLSRNSSDYDSITPPGTSNVQEFQRLSIHQDLPSNHNERPDIFNPKNASLCSTQIDPSSPRPSWAFSQTSTVTNSPNSSLGKSTGKRMQIGIPAPDQSPHVLPSPTTTICGNIDISWPIPISTNAIPRVNSLKLQSPHTPRTSWYSPSRKRIISPPIPLRPPPPSRSTSQEKPRPSLAPIHRRAPKPPTKKPSGNSLTSMKRGPLRKKSLQFLENLPSFMDFDSDREDKCGLARLWCGAGRGEKKCEVGGNDTRGKKRRSRNRSEKARCKKKEDDDKGMSLKAGEYLGRERIGRGRSDPNAKPLSTATLRPLLNARTVRERDANRETEKRRRWRKLDFCF